MSESSKLPKATVGDRVHAVVRSGLGTIPIGGAAAIEFLCAIWVPPLERRRNQWCEALGERLQRLEDAGLTSAEDLAENEVFITTMMHASQVALRNHHADKLDALRNAVLNAALPDPPDESIQHMFIQLVDEFTVWHIRILRFLQDPRSWLQQRDMHAPEHATVSFSTEQVLLIAFPELKGQREFYVLVDTTLGRKGLTKVGGMDTAISKREALIKQTTEFGDRFLAFILKPDEA